MNNSQKSLEVVRLLSNVATCSILMGLLIIYTDNTSQSIIVSLISKNGCSSDLVLPAEGDRKLSGSLLSLDLVS